MKALVTLSVFAALFIALFGCAAPGGPYGNATANATQGAISQDQIADGGNASGSAATRDTAYSEYKQDTFSFDYPQSLKAQESLGSYNGGRGYAFVALQNDIATDPALLVYYIRFGNISMLANKSADAIAKGLLESDNSGTDVMGVLHQASDKSAISSFTSKNGYAGAEMTFVLKDPDGTQQIHGYAIQLYDARTTVSMKARVIGMDQATAKAARDRFVESAKISDLPS